MHLIIMQKIIITNEYPYNFQQFQYYHNNFNNYIYSNYINNYNYFNSIKK